MSNPKMVVFRKAGGVSLGGLLSGKLADQETGKDTHTMKSNTVFELKTPDTFYDDL